MHFPLANFRLLRRSAPSIFNSVSNRQSLTRLGIIMGGISSLLICAPKANALEEVRLAYNGYQFGTLEMEELSSFASTGEASADIQALLEAIDIDTASARAMLNSEVTIKSAYLPEVAETFMGESFFQLVGTTFTVPDEEESSWVYLRSAFLDSAVDSQVSFIDVLQSFDVDAIVIDTDRIGPVTEQIKNDVAVISRYFAEDPQPVEAD
ncbi:MAG: alpha/beta hydrolase [Phormidesmis sp.]